MMPASTSEPCRRDYPADTPIRTIGTHSEHRPEDLWHWPVQPVDAAKHVHSLYGNRSVSVMTSSLVPTSEISFRPQSSEKAPGNATG